MSTQSNKEVVRRFTEEAINRWNPARMDDYYTADFVNHTASPGDDPGRAGLRKFFTQLKAALPDMPFTTEDLIAEGDKVVHRVTIHGTHRGEYLGETPTGKPVTWPYIVIIRMTDGKFAELWVQGDALGFLQQLGLIPPGGQAGA
jgi:predicted ester cyclase